jgi:hypothetical protein
MDKTTVMAESVIRGDNFDPKIINQKLNIESTKCWTKNTDKKPKTLKTKTISENFKRITDRDLKELSIKRSSKNN